MRPSATSATIAMITIAANTPSALNVPCAWEISRPRPRCAPRNSPTIAPISAKPKLMCMLAMIHVIAEGSTTWRVTCRGEAPRIRALATRLRSTSRAPWKALKNTAKNTSTTASATFDVSPSPNQRMKIEPSTMRGIEFITLM
jgi:hypothetical protein